MSVKIFDGDSASKRESNLGAFVLVEATSDLFSVVAIEVPTKACSMGAL